MRSSLHPISIPPPSPSSRGNSRFVVYLVLLNILTSHVIEFSDPLIEQLYTPCHQSACSNIFISQLLNPMLFMSVILFI